MGLAYLAPSPDLGDKNPERTGGRESEFHVPYEAHYLEVLESHEHRSELIQCLVCHSRGGPSGCGAG
jgi:hypothetical protein